MALSGCTPVPNDAAPRAPEPRPGVVAPPALATTAEQFDTTTTAERAAALSKPAGTEKRLGVTIASLGNPAEPGLWLETPLVTTPVAGRLVTDTGKSAAVDLRPSGGSGSRISLAAMRLLGLTLTDLPELTVYVTR